MIVRKPSLGPLELGRELEVLKQSPTEAGVDEGQFIILADTVLISIQATVVTGTLKVDVFTEGDDTDLVSSRLQIIDFPLLSAPTSELLLRKAASTLQKVRVVVTYTGSCSYIIRARGTAIGEASFKLLGATTAKHSGTSIGTSATLILPVALEDRNGVSIMNNNASGIMYVGFTSGVTVAAGALAGTPVKPGGSIGLDIAAGLGVYGIADVGSLDIRILELG